MIKIEVEHIHLHVNIFMHTFFLFFYSWKLFFSCRECDIESCLQERKILIDFLFCLVADKATPVYNNSYRYLYCNENV